MPQPWKVRTTHRHFVLLAKAPTLCAGFSGEASEGGDRKDNVGVVEQLGSWGGNPLGKHQDVTSTSLGSNTNYLCPQGEGKCGAGALGFSPRISWFLCLWPQASHFLLHPVGASCKLQKTGWGQPCPASLSLQEHRPFYHCWAKASVSDEHTNDCFICKLRFLKGLTLLRQFILSEANFYTNLGPTKTYIFVETRRVI